MFESPCHILLIFKTFLIKTIFLLFLLILLRQWSAMGVEESYWGITDLLFLQDSPPLLTSVNLKKGGNFEVNMREKEEALVMEEKIGVLSKTIFSYKTPVKKVSNVIQRHSIYDSF